MRDADIRAARLDRAAGRRCATGSRSSNGAQQVPQRGELLVETFPRADKNYLVCYPFEGRLAHQTLGMLLTRRLERARLRPLGFVANEYALAVWGLGDAAFDDPARRTVDLAALFDRGHAGRRPGGMARRIRADEAHLPATARIISGLIARRFTGEEKTKRQMTVLDRPRSTTCCAGTRPTTCCCAPPAPMPRPGLLDIKRLGDMLARIKGQSSTRNSTASRRWRCR